MSDAEKGPNGFPYIDSEKTEIGMWESGDFRMRVKREDGEVLNVNLRPNQFRAFMEAIGYVQANADNGGKSE